MDNCKVTRGLSQPSISFINIDTEITYTDIWDELEAGLWKKFSVDNYMFNNSIGEINQHEWHPLFPNFKVINQGFMWDAVAHNIFPRLYKPNIKDDVSLNTFLRTAEQFFNNFSDKKVGVHLSGGLDSSLVIALLKHLNIPFVAIGLCSQRFEFRTERTIQYIMAEYADDALLLDMDNYPFYSNLDKKPKQQIPDANIKMIDASYALAKEFKNRGCQIVISGQGGDTLLAESMTDITTFEGYNIDNEFSLSWEQDFIYSPMGLELHSFFSDKGIIDQITSLRKYHHEDPLKVWARSFFKSLLPRELSEYTYFADFFGHSIDGLNQAKPSFRLLFEEAYDRLQHPMFSPKGMKQFLNQDILTLEYNTYCEFCSKLSIAAWIHSLFRND